MDPAEVAGATGMERHAYDHNGALLATTTADPFASLPALPERTERLTWAGSIYWPTDRPVTLRLDSATPIAVRLADAPVVEAGPGTRRVPVQLARGWQRLALDESELGGRALSELHDHGDRLAPPLVGDAHDDAVEHGGVVLQGLREHAACAVFEARMHEIHPGVQGYAKRAAGLLESHQILRQRRTERRQSGRRRAFGGAAFQFGQVAREATRARQLKLNLEPPQ
jgi:hypothetical protein